MNKIISSFLLILSCLVITLLVISSLLTYEKGIKFFLNFSQDTHIELVLNKSHWHPYKPSIEIDVLSAKSTEDKSKLVELEELKIEFNLFSIFEGSLVKSMYAKNVTMLITPSSDTASIKLNDLWFYIPFIENLKIDTFSLMDSKNYSNILNGELSLITSKSRHSKVIFSAQNINGGNLDLRMHSILGSKSFKDYKGFIETSDFNLNRGITKQFCSDCPGGTLDSKVWFTLIDLTLIKLLGDIKFKLNSSIDFIESINARIELENPNNNIFRISSYLNKDPLNSLPEIFASLKEEAVFFIPTIELGEDKFINRFKHLFKIPNDLLIKGFLNELIFDFDDTFRLKANFENLSLQSSKFYIAGLKGNLKYSPDISKLWINSPYLELNVETLFDNPLIFNNFSSMLDLRLVDKKVSISKSAFKGSYKQNLIQGQVNLFPSPFDDTGDLSLEVSSDGLDYLDVLNLFPNLNFTKSTKSWLKKSVSCGLLEKVSFIYRGPIDNKYDDSSSSFHSKGFLKEACLNVNSVDIKEINLIAKINNSSFLGEVTDGNLYESRIKGEIKTFKDNNKYKLELKGNSKGPFLSILNISKFNQIFDSELEESGEHSTNFYFYSPLNSNLDLLGEDADLELVTKIKGGNFKNKNTNLSFSDLYSSLEYDSSSGIKEGFATIKINGIPVKFDIRKGKENGIFNTQLVAEDFFSSRKIFSSFDFKKSIKGSSKFKIQVTIPSFRKEQPLIDPKIEVLSGLEGIAINLPEPFSKSKDTKINFSLTFKPFLNRSPQLSFKYGDLFRGKFNLQNNKPEGFVIAGKRKQSISILDEKIILVGELQRLDLGSLISSGIFEAEGSGNFFIKDLIIEETNFANLSLFKTRFKSSRSNDGIEYKFFNDDLSGTLLIPEEDNRNLSFRFDFIKINQDSSMSRDNFLSLYNSVEDHFNFSTEALFLNSKNFGAWEFSILPETDQLILNDIKGTYGKWGLKRTNEGISSLTIHKKPVGWTSTLKTNIYSGSPEKAMQQIGIKPNFELDTLSLDVDLTWKNLPWLFDYNSINGEVFTDLKGLTIKNNEDLETTNNLLRLINIFNITDSFEKVTNLDFRKLYKRGFSADSITGRFRINDKSLQIKEPILLKSGSSQFNWTGEISRDNKGNLDRLNLEVIMTLPLREYLPAYALVLGGPITAGVVYIAGKAFERNLDKLSSGKWTVEGNISKPKTEFDGWFEDNSEK